MGVKIPRPGYLDPHPISLQSDGTITLGFVKQGYIDIIPIKLKIIQPFTSKKTFLFKFSICRLWRGQDIQGELSRQHSLLLSVDVTISFRFCQTKLLSYSTNKIEK